MKVLGWDLAENFMPKVGIRSKGSKGIWVMGMGWSELLERVGRGI